MKKLKISPIVIVCYVLAALTLVYFFYLLGSTYKTIADYYAAYDMKPQVQEVITYVLQSGLAPLVNAVLLFMAGYILNAVRKLDPNNYVTVEEPVKDLDAADEDSAEVGAEADTVEFVAADADEDVVVIEEAAVVTEESVEATALEAARAAEAAFEEAGEATDTVAEEAVVVTEKDVEATALEAAKAAEAAFEEAGEATDTVAEEAVVVTEEDVEATALEAAKAAEAAVEEAAETVKEAAQKAEEKVEEKAKKRRKSSKKSTKKA